MQLHFILTILYGFICAGDPDRFTVILNHNGLFCGLQKDDLEYISSSIAHWDNCNTDTFSRLWIDHFIDAGECDRKDKCVLDTPFQNYEGWPMSY